MNAINQLKEIFLLNKVVKELEISTGLKKENEEDKKMLNILANFVIDLCVKSKNLDEFIRKLNENESDFPLTAVQNLFRMIKEVKGSGEEQKKGMIEDREEDNNEDDDFHANLLSEEAKGILTKKFASLAIPNRNKEELDLEMGVIFEDEEKKADKLEEKVRNVEISPVRIHRKEDKDENLRKREKESRDRKRSRSRDRKKRRDRSKSRSKSKSDSRKHKKRKYSRSLSSDVPRERKTSKIDEQRQISNQINPLPVEEVKVGQIYSGRVTNIQPYGCFVRLDIPGVATERNTGNTRNARNTPNCRMKEGLVHIGQIRKFPRVEDIREVIRPNQEVKVKIISMENGKISLSMKDVDQTTGEDLTNQPPKSSYLNKTSIYSEFDFSDLNEDTKFNPIRPNEVKETKVGELTGISIDTKTEVKSKKRLSSPELWELNQLKHANALDYIDDPLGVDAQEEDGELEENAEIELREEEPPFLKGQTAKAGIHFSPIRIVKNADGPLQRAAIQQGELAKDRRELREQQQRSVLDNIPEEILNQFDDPNLPLKNRIQNIKEISKNQYDPVDWKKEPLVKKFQTTSRSLMSIKEQRESLPIFRLKEELIKTIDENRILVVIGETGSGKTTQMTQYLVEHGYAKYGKIACTQPRRVAAMSVAKRVSEEFGCKLGEYVGYSIRFDDCCSQDTIIKYMTDGMLLREALIDKNLTQYSVIMLDEAHERTIHTDILFGLLKQALRVRNDLKLIVTSATLDADKFTAFFNNCPKFSIPGRTFPVEVFYAKETESDYLDAALITVMQIHLTEPRGDILVFLTGQEEIDTACQILNDRMEALGKDVPPMIILPVYSALPSDMQTKIFEPAPEGSRKCVIATNIAEASLTIDGIYYVVDPGYAKIKAYNPKIGMDSLVVAPISQSSAQQRAGRAGRTGPGKCYRLYTLESFQNEMLFTTIPEIQRTNLANTVLLLKAMGINDLINFDFMDPPPVQTLISAMEQLYNLGALDEEGLLTRLGRRMAEFPLEPQLSKMLLTSVDLGCSEEIITIVSMLSVQNIFYRPRDRQALADQKRAKFYHPDGDHLTLLNVYQMWKSNKCSYPWCHDNFIQARAMKKAEDIKKQLVAIMERYKLPVKNCGKDYDRVRKSITAGFFTHVARKDPKEGYKTLVDNQTIYIHPSSALFNKAPEWVVYHELVLTSKEYMRECTAIEPKWLVEVAGRFFKQCNPNFMSKRMRNERLEPLHNKYEDPNAWRLSKRRGMIY